MTREEAIRYLEQHKYSNTCGQISLRESNKAIDMAIEALQREEAEANGYCHRIKPKAVRMTKQGEWISRIDNDIWMLECSVCGCRVQEEKYRIAVGQNATKCPYCGAELGLGGYSYDEYADRPSQRGEDE